MGEESVNINYKDAWKRLIDFLSRRDVQLAIVGILLLIVLFWSSSIRTSNLPLLKDQTTGEYIPVALDPFYFLRMAETIQENGGSLPTYDSLRQPFDVGWTSEILPDTIYFLHKVLNVFGEYSIQYVDVIIPVVFFVIGLIAFFILVFILTRSKLVAIISSLFLAFIPSYLYRSMAGFSDHESIGMAVFFISLIVLTISFKTLEKYGNKKSDFKRVLIESSMLGIMTTIMIVSWGGIAIFLLMIIPLAFFMLWVLYREHLSDYKKALIPIAYVIWIITGVIFGLLTRYGVEGIYRWFTTGMGGTIVLFVLGFLLVDVVANTKLRKKISFVRWRNPFISAIVAVILGAIILSFMGTNVFDLIIDFFSRLIHPFGTERVGLTVAENKQPFLKDWTSNIGPRFFWLFLLGVFFMGVRISKYVKNKFHRKGFIISWLIFIGGLTFSRISSDSILNGTNFFSKLIYFGSIILFGGYLLYLYLKDEIEPIDSRWIILFSLLVPMLIGARGAIRLFFVITPITCVGASYGFYFVSRKFFKTKEDNKKLFWGIASIIVLLLLMFSLNSFVKTTAQQAKYTGPSASIQWQKAMEWVRDNTQANATFLHWWDYGYWVQYLGKRATLADGGRFQGSFRDHLIGRYFLTNPEVDSALSFMKSNEVTHILIDPTDIGKYSAYSSIGSDLSGSDRYTLIPSFVLNPSQTRETNDSTITIYQGGSAVDQDIVYDLDGKDVFLPSGRAALIGILIETSSSGNEIYQPEGVFYYQDQQIRIPLKQVYFNGELHTFTEGLDSAIIILPAVASTAQGQYIENMGAVMYLSSKTKDSLFSQMYLMDDPSNKFPTISLVHSEPDPLIESIQNQGATIGDFLFYQGQIKGPIKIWEVDYPENIIFHEEFLRFSGEYAGFDNLKFKE